MELPQEIIAIKREGGSLSSAQIQHFIDGVVSGEFRDYQASALLMAVVLKGMNIDETQALTQAMMRSGKVLSLVEIDRPKVDKHSTGGVGDKTSLILAPIAAALGLCVPMMSGRGLGHTGGTLDKLESIPGFRTQLSEAEYRKQLETIHLAIIGQSKDMVPADRILYALRDVTGTVESIPLITSSILSKKLAAGIDSLVLDVKCGQGAFMKTLEDARALAKSLTETCAALGKPCSALITSMESPLGQAIGNSLEVREAIECLKGRGPADLMEVTIALVAEMLLMAGRVETREEAGAVIQAVIEDGSALNAFRDMVTAQGGDPACVDDLEILAIAQNEGSIVASDQMSGYLTKIDALAVGEAARLLGAGRTHTEDQLDLSVGIFLHKQVGDPVEPSEKLATLYYNESGRVLAAEKKLLAAYSVDSALPSKSSLILETIPHTRNS